MENFEITLHDCLVARRGKGVKGQTQEFKSFGVPVYEKDAKPGEPVVDFDYEPYKTKGYQELIDAFEKMSGLSNELIRIGMVAGIDDVRRSETKQSKSEFNALVAFIKEQDLHKDDADAEILAKAWQSNQASCKRIHAPILSIEEMAKNRRNWIEEQKEKGIWRGKLVPKSDDTETK